MRQTFGGTWLMQLMILFILLFVAFIVLSLNYSKTVRIKNQVIGIIEKYEGLNDKSLEIVNSYLVSTNYGVTGVCTKDSSQQGLYGALSLDNNSLEEARPNVKYYYCIKKYRGANTSRYYQLTVFYKFNLPVVGDRGRFMVKGTSTNFVPSDDNRYAQAVGGFMDRPSIGTNSGTNTGNRPNTNTNNNTNNNNNSNNSSGNRTYTVIFNLDGGDGYYPTQTVSFGGSATKPSNEPTKIGYKFDGWYLSGSAYNFGNSVNSNIVLQAKWLTINEMVTITYDLNGGVYLYDSFAQIIDGNAVVSNLNSYLKNTQFNNGKMVRNVNKGEKIYYYSGGITLSKKGYRFGGWTLNGSEFKSGTAVNSDIVLTAKWVPINYSYYLAYDFDGGVPTDRCGIYDKYYVTYSELPAWNVFASVNSCKLEKPGYTLVCFAKRDGNCWDHPSSWTDNTVLSEDFYVKAVWRKN